MTEKYFAATPYTCHKQFQISIIICEKRIMAYGKIPLKLKDFEGIYAPADKKHSHFLRLKLQLGYPVSAQKVAAKSFPQVGFCLTPPFSVFHGSLAVPPETNQILSVAFTFHV